MNIPCVRCGVQVDEGWKGREFVALPGIFQAHLRKEFRCKLPPTCLKCEKGLKEWWKGGHPDRLPPPKPTAPTANR